MYSASFCWILFFTISTGDGLLLLLVNRAEVISVKDDTFNRNDISSTYKYSYIDGDAVDISCLSLGRGRAVKLKYDFMGDHFSYDTLKKTNTVIFNRGVGLRAVLSSTHDHTNISCEFFGVNYKATLNVIFIMKEKFDDFCYWKINDFTLRHNKNQASYIVYYLHKESNIKLESKANGDDVVVVTSQLKSNNMNWQQRTHETTLLVKPKSYNILKFEIKHKTTDVLLRTMEINFKQLDNLNDTRPLYLYTPNTHILIVYAFDGRQLIYYEYEDGDTSTLNCSTTPNIPKLLGFYLDFNGTATNKTYIIKRTTLTAAHDNTTISCAILYQYNGQNISTVMKEIQVLFRMRKPRIGEDIITRYGIPVSLSAMCIVLVICAGLCYMKRRNHHIQASGAGKVEESGYVNVNSSIQSYEPGALYSVPHRQKRDDDNSSDPQYCELRPTLNAVAPTSPAKQMTVDINYADLDISQSNKVFKNSCTEESPYAEVCHEVSVRFHPNVPYKRK